MTLQLTDKKNSLNIIKILSSVGEISKKELLNNLGIAQSTLYKHLKVARETGFEINAKSNFIEFKEYKEVISLSSGEVNMICYMLLVAYVFLPLKKVKLFQKSVDKMLRLTDRKTAQEVERKYEIYKMATISEYYSGKIDILKKYINDNKSVIIVLKNGVESKIIPLEFNWINDKLYLKYLDFRKEEKSISLDFVVKVIENRMQIEVPQKDGTVFELYGRLSKSYLLKEDEEILDYGKDKIVVGNYSKDKEKLFKRLLRYDTLCKVTKPIQDVERFKIMVQESLDRILNMDL